MWIAILLLLIFLPVGLLLYMFICACRARPDVQQIELETLPEAFDGTAVLFISDIHRRKISAALVESCMNLGKIDLVLIGGDLKEAGVPLPRSRHNVRMLAKLAPVYMVYGNHDYDDDIRALDVMLREEGVRLLINESVILEKPNGARIRLSGVDDPHTKRDRLEQALEADEKEAAFTLLLAHDPVIMTRIDKLQDKVSVDLVLAGHTHGGQIFLPFIGSVFRSFWNRGWYWPKSAGGFDTAGKIVHKRNKARMFVSCGFGTSKLPLRFRAPSEYHLFTLRSAAGKK
ncbi:metallophosphoesterase [Paenibacillus sp. GCM10027626]|uniref:metallophosphoesterase n=1 Tax=Paenibacillus sp. GCM10027626 TaxID=3273411 RepID=UPI003628F82D